MSVGAVQQKTAGELVVVGTATVPYMWSLVEHNVNNLLVHRVSRDLVV